MSVEPLALPREVETRMLVLSKNNKTHSVYKIKQRTTMTLSEKPHWTHTTHRNTPTHNIAIHTILTTHKHAHTHTTHTRIHHMPPPPISWHFPMENTKWDANDYTHPLINMADTVSKTKPINTQTHTYARRHAHAYEQTSNVNIQLFSVHSEEFSIQNGFRFSCGSLSWSANTHTNQQDKDKQTYKQKQHRTDPANTNTMSIHKKHNYKQHKNS